MMRDKFGLTTYQREPYATVVMHRDLGHEGALRLSAWPEHPGARVFLLRD